MKKVLAVLAVLMVAAAAHADVLASWGAQGKANGELEEGYYWQNDMTIGVTDMTATKGSITTTSTYNFRLAGNGAVEFGYNALENVYGAKMEGDYHATGAASRNGDWYLNEQKVDTIVRTTTTVSPFSASLGNISEGTGTIAFKADTTAGKVTGGDYGTGGNIDLINPKLTGSTTAVPEPATMSLLGLGALAMALRRKLRK